MGRTSEFEVIDVDDEEKLELRVEIAAWPLRTYRYVADALTVFIHFFFPKRSGVGMTVKRFLESTHRSAHVTVLLLP